MTRQATFTKRSMLLATVAMAALGLSGCGEEAKTEWSDSERAAVVERIKPVAVLQGMPAPEAPMAEAAPVAAEPAAPEAAPEPAAPAAASAKALYDAKCMMCHSTGAAGAPMLGEAAAWEPRMANGIDGLLATAKTGKGAMPPNGGSAYSDDEMRQVVEFMLAEAGLN